MQSSSGPPTSTPTSGTVSVSVAVSSSTPQSALKTVSGSLTNLPTHRVPSTLARNTVSGAVRPSAASAGLQQSYHVPRGAAAVASIAVPRSASLATPIVRGGSGSQSNTTTVGSTSAISSYATAGGFRTPGHTQSPAWEGTNAPRVASPGPLRSVHAAPRAPIATYTHPNRSTPNASLTTTTRTTVPGRDTPRPVLQQTSIQKTVSKVQSAAQTSTQLHGPEKTFLKGGVSLQTVRTSAAPQPQLVTAPTAHQITVTQSPVSRFTSTAPQNSSISQPVPPTTLSQTSGPVGLTTSGRTVSLVARSGGPTQSNQSGTGASQSSTQQPQPTMVLTTPGTLPTPVLTSGARLTSPAIISGTTSASRLTVSGAQPSLPSQVLTGTARIMSQPGAAVISGARLPAAQGRITYTGATAPLVPQNARLPTAPLLTSPVRVGAGITPTLTSSTRLSVPAGGMVSLQSMVVTNNPTVVTGTAPLKAGQPSAQPAGIRTLPPQSLTVSNKPNAGPSIQITSTVVSTGPSSVIGTNTCSNVSTMASLRTVGSSTSSINSSTNTTSVTTSTKTAAYAQTPVTLSTLSSLTSLSARPVAVQSQPISVTKVFPQGLGMVGSVGMNVGVAEVSLPVHAMQAVQTSSSQSQTSGPPSQPTSVYIQTASHRASPGPAGTQLTVDRSSSAFTLPTTTYYLDPASYQMSMANVTGVANVPAGSLVARAGATPYAIQATATQAVQAVRAGIGTSTPQQVHSLVTNAPPVRFNPMMVVDHGRIPVQASIVSAEDCGGRQVQGEIRTEGKDSRQSVIQQFPSSLQRPTSVVQNGGGTAGRALITTEGNLVSAPASNAGPVQGLPQPTPTPQTQSQQTQPQAQSLSVQTAQIAQAQQPQQPPIVPQQTQPTKPNASPRPSILRKRDIEGSPLKAQRNLTPILAGISASHTTPSSLPSSLPSTAPASPPSPPKRPDSGGHQSSGSTTISATSSPGLNDLNDDSPPPLRTPSAASIAAGIHAAVASGSVPSENVESVVKREVELTHEKPPILEMSPRKKPRKQQLTGNELQEQKFSEDEMEFLSEERVRKEPKDDHEDRGPRQAQPSQHVQPQHDQQQKHQQVQQQQQQQASSAASTQREAYPKRNGLTLLSTYRYTWKSRHNHFLRHSDVRPKEERRPTVSELAAQKYIQQRLNGWKVHHLTTQMEDLAELEMQVCAQLGEVLKLIEKKSKKEGAEQDRDINRVNELIKGNMQRSQVIADGMLEAKSTVMKIFEHRPRVAEIINRSSGKRTFKKREKS